jgi:iron complex transport system permease protein
MSLSLGAVSISPAEVGRVLADRLGLPVDQAAFSVDAVIWNIRLPRVLAGVVVGATLALTGAALQGLYRNRLADPQLVGIGPGAALGGAIGYLASGSDAAVVGGVLAGVAAAMIVRRFGRTPSIEPSRFVLIGVAFSAAVSAWVGFIVFAGSAGRLPPIEFWLLGSLAGTTWGILGLTALVAGTASAVMVAWTRRLDVMALGEAEARHLGLDVDRTITIFSVLIGAAVGATVGAVGVIAFVGLLVPHLLRRVTGPAHLHLLWASALGGASFLVLADLVARTVASPREIPVGFVTAAVGGPFFIWLIYRSREI